MLIKIKIMLLHYIIWNVRPQLFDFGKFEIRYYSILFALGFVIGYFILLRIFKKEGYTVELLDILTIYMVLSTIIGARLGHCLFYEFNYYIQHPLEIILPWRGKIGEDFEFTGFQGLASHGAAIGILIGIYLFARNTKTSYWWTLDKLVIVTALGACLIRTGNLMNSEIYGKPTRSNYGFIFTHDFTQILTKGNTNKYVKKVQYKIAQKDSFTSGNIVPIDLYLTLSNKIRNDVAALDIVRGDINYALLRNDYQQDIIHPDANKLEPHILKSGKNYVVSLRIYGIPRHPSQIYEALVYLLIFFLLMIVYLKYTKQLREGFLLGLFLFLVFIARFLIEFLKANQEEFEEGMLLNMGQWLSIPFIIIGLILVFTRWPKLCLNET
jgi:prolipoprotein diacylglyceryl transferase